MIRHAGISRFEASTTDADVEAFAKAFAALEIEGCSSQIAERGLGLRGSKDGDFFIVAEFEDEDAFWRYDTDPAHEELRASLVGKLAPGGKTCQYLTEPTEHTGRPLIRHIGIVDFNPGTSEEEIDAFIAAFMALDVEGWVSRSASRGLGLRDRDADLIVVAEFEDEAAFRRYDSDPEHEEFRAGLAGRIVAGGITAQYMV